MIPHIVVAILALLLNSTLNAQEGTSDSYMSRDECKALVIPYFETKYKKCLAVDNNINCNQYIDFSFYEALESACINESVEKLRLSEDALYRLFDDAFNSGYIDLDAALDQLKDDDFYYNNDSLSPVENENLLLDKNDQLTELENQDNSQIPDANSSTSPFSNVKKYVDQRLEYSTQVMQKYFTRSDKVTNYRVFPPVFSETTIISNAINAVPLTQESNVWFKTWSFFILLVSILYGVLLAIPCWIIFPVVFVVARADISLLKFGSGSLALFTLGNVIQSIKGLASIGKSMASTGLWGMAGFLLLLFTCYVILTIPINTPIRYYQAHVYGGVDYDTHQNIKEARSYWSESISYKPYFEITRVDLGYVDFDKTDERDKDGYLLSSFDRAYIDINITNNSNYPLIHGEILCELNFRSGETIRFVDYIAAKPKVIINNYGKKEFKLYHNSEKAIWSPDLEEIMVRTEDVNALEDSQKQLKVKCIPLASYHKKNMFEQKDQPVKAVFNKEREILTVVNNSDDYVSQFTLECIVNDKPSQYDSINYETDDTGKIVREYYDVKPSYTRQEFLVDRNDGYIPPGGKREYDFSGSQYSKPLDKNTARENAGLQITVFNDLALNTTAFNLSRSTQCGIYDITKVDVTFFDKYLIYIVIYVLLVCIILFTPTREIKGLRT